MKNEAYLKQIKANHPHLKFTSTVSASVKAGDVVRVVHGRDCVEIIHRDRGQLLVAVMDGNNGQAQIIKFKREICQRKEYLDRVEDWECRNHLDIFDASIMFRLIDSRMSAEEREETELIRTSGTGMTKANSDFNVNESNYSEIGK